MSGTTLVKKHLVRPYLDKSANDTPDWVQIKKAVDFSRDMGAQTEDREYIADESATTEVTGYKPSQSLEVTTYSGEDDFELFFDMYKKRAIGSDAHKKYLVVYMFESVTVEGETGPCYYAELTDATVTVNTANWSGSALSVNVAENGTPQHGWVKYVSGAPVFTSTDD